jgi:hypothetical protein
MKTKTILVGLLAVSFFVIYCSSCTQNNKIVETELKIGNTLKSISLISDSSGIDPYELLSSFERVNKAIDSIGYPDAGYQLWLVQSDTTKDYKYMVEGSWPNQAIYDTIHNNELYLNATKAEEKVWVGKDIYLYSRFTIVKK